MNEARSAAPTWQLPWAAPARLAARAGTVWRQSLRLRVVAATVALCLVVVVLLGTFLVTRVRNGLLESKRDIAVAVAGAGTVSAQRQFDALDPGNATQRDQTAISVVEKLSSAGGQAGRNEVLLVASPEPPDRPGDSSAAATTAGAVDYSSGPATREDLPERLRTRVQDGDAAVWTYVSMPVDGAGDSAAPATVRMPAIAVGERVFVPGAGPYELYFLLPLEQEQRTLALVQRAVAVAGLFLLLLVGLVAYVVAHSVVTPVRMAARIAQRLAAGRLEERMVVRGEDDLARLALSFNSMAASLQHQIRQLEDLSRLQRRFVSDVSHELRTPLTTVRMAADVLHESRRSFPPMVSRSSELLQSQLEHFETLLTDLLEISRFDAGAATLEADQHDIRLIVRRVLNAVEPLAVRKGSAVTLHLPTTPALAEVDPRRIERILRNLLVNAIEHGHGKPVVITVAANESAVAVTVRDFGVGLGPGEAERVFDRFWRADPARARTTGGTGLGLSIAVEDAHLHGGELSAWGAPGEGAQFCLQLPRSVGTPVEVPPLTADPAGGQLTASRPPQPPVAAEPGAAEPASGSADGAEARPPSSDVDQAPVAGGKT